MASEDTQHQNTWGYDYICPFFYTTTTTPFYNITANPQLSSSLYPDDTGSISSDIEILSHGDFSAGSSGGDNGYPSGENGGGPDSSATKHVVEHVGQEGEGVDPEAVSGHVYFEQVQGQPAAQWLTHG